MRNKIKQIGLILLLILFIFTVLRSSSVIGVTTKHLEQDARKSHRINNSWEVSQSVNKKIGAMVFYNDLRDSYIFSIYLNHPGFSFGYFFYSGGALGEIDDSIRRYKFDQYGSVLVSMNRMQVSKIQLDNDIEVTTIDIDSSKPFVQVIPSNSGNMTIVNVYGEEVSDYVVN